MPNTAPATVRTAKVQQNTKKYLPSTTVRSTVAKSSSSVSKRRASTGSLKAPATAARVKTEEGIGQPISGSKLAPRGRTVMTAGPQKRYAAQSTTVSGGTVKEARPPVYNHQSRLPKVKRRGSTGSAPSSAASSSHSSSWRFPSELLEQARNSASNNEKPNTVSEPFLRDNNKLSIQRTKPQPATGNMNAKTENKNESLFIAAATQRAAKASTLTDVHIKKQVSRQTQATPKESTSRSELAVVYESESIEIKKKECNQQVVVISESRRRTPRRYSWGGLNSSTTTFGALEKPKASQPKPALHVARLGQAIKAPPRHRSKDGRGQSRRSTRPNQSSSLFVEPGKQIDSKATTSGPRFVKRRGSTGSTPLAEARTENNQARQEPKERLLQRQACFGSSAPQGATLEKNKRKQVKLDFRTIKRRGSTGSLNFALLPTRFSGAQNASSPRVQIKGRSSIESSGPSKNTGAGNIHKEYTVARQDPAIVSGSHATTDVSHNSSPTAALDEGYLHAQPTAPRKRIQRRSSWGGLNTSTILEKDRRTTSQEMGDFDNAKPFKDNRSGSSKPLDQGASKPLEQLKATSSSRRVTTKRRGSTGSTPVETALSAGAQVVQQQTKARQVPRQTSVEKINKKQHRSFGVQRMKR
ncbi:hypothetical protein ACA910_006515 [Epithemia clementina (nom. ined.)]